MSLFGMDPYDFVEETAVVKQEKERKCRKCDWVGVSKEHAAGPCIPTLEDVADRNGRVNLPLGTKVDTPIGVGTVVKADKRPFGRVVQTRLHCAEKGCQRYLNGYFTAVDVGYFETKKGMCDLRNQEYWCDKHAHPRSNQ